MADREEEFARNRETPADEASAAEREALIEDPPVDEAAAEREALIKANLRLVQKIANDFLGRGLEWDDLVAEGNLGLVNAVDHFDPDRGTKFSSYSAWWIKQAIRKAIGESKTIRVPPGTQLRRSRIRRAEHELLEQNGGVRPSDEELAKATGLSLETVRRQRDGRPPELRSLNEIVGSDSDEGTELGNLIVDPSAVAPDQETIHIEEIEQLLAYLDKLPPRERQVLQLRFGLDGKPVYTLDEVGELLGCSNERVRQIQARALKRLQRSIRDGE